MLHAAWHDGCSNQLMSFDSFISVLKRHKVLANKKRKCPNPPKAEHARFIGYTEHQCNLQGSQQSSTCSAWMRASHRSLSWRYFAMIASYSVSAEVVEDEAVQVKPHWKFRAFVHHCETRRAPEKFIKQKNKVLPSGLWDMWLYFSASFCHLEVVT